MSPQASDASASGRGSSGDSRHSFRNLPWIARRPREHRYGWAPVRVARRTGLTDMKRPRSDGRDVVAPMAELLVVLHVERLLARSIARTLADVLDVTGLAVRLANIHLAQIDHP